MKKMCFLITGLLAMAALAAQTVNINDTPRISLSEVLHRIEQQYPALRQYEERIKAIEQQVAGATAWMAPMFSVSPSNFAYRTSMWKENSPMNQAGIMFSLTQNIPNPSRLRAQRNYYASLAGIEKNNQQWTLNTLRTAAKLFFIQRLIAERKLSIIAESQELLRIIIKVAEEKYVFNQSELSVIYKARSRMGDLTNMRQMQLSLIKTTTIGLNTLMNQNINQAFTIDTTARLKHYEASVHQYMDSSLQLDRSDVRSINSTIQSMRNDQVARAAMRKPDFAIGVTHSQMLGMPKTWTLMGGVTIPIVPWTSKGWKAEIRMLDYEISAMLREKETMQLMARQMIAERLTMLGYETQQYHTFDAIIVPELRKNVETALLQYQQTTGNLFVLLDAWDMLLMKRMEQQDKLGLVLQGEAQYEFETEKR